MNFPSQGWQSFIMGESSMKASLAQKRLAFLLLLPLFLLFTPFANAATSYSYDAAGNLGGVSTYQAALTTLTLGGSPNLGYHGTPVTFDLTTLPLSGADQQGNPFNLTGQTITWAVSGPATVSGSTLTVDNFGQVGVTASVGTVASNTLSFNVPMASPFTFASSGTFTVPAGANLLTVACCGGAAGGNGGCYNGNPPEWVYIAGAGGAAGATGLATFPVSSGQQYSISIGAGGTGGLGAYYSYERTAGNAGGNSVFSGNGISITGTGGPAGSLNSYTSYVLESNGGPQPSIYYAVDPVVATPGASFTGVSGVSIANSNGTTGDALFSGEFSSSITGGAPTCVPGQGETSFFNGPGNGGAGGYMAPQGQTYVATNGAAGNGGQVTIWWCQTSANGSQAYSAPGAYTFTVPAGVDQLTVASCGGGSGGNGGGYNPNPPVWYMAGAGGAAGATGLAVVPVIPGQQFTVTVGAGGAGGAGGTLNPTAGSAGGNSVFSGNGISVTGTGGPAGSLNSYTAYTIYINNQFALGFAVDPIVATPNASFMGVFGLSCISIANLNVNGDALFSGSFSSSSGATPTCVPGQGETSFFNGSGNGGTGGYMEPLGNGQYTATNGAAGSGGQVAIWW